MKHIICDLDGTLSLTAHRQHYLEKSPPDWDGFFLACGDDEPNIPVCGVADALYSYCMCGEDGTNVKFVIFSGRSDIAKDITRQWLEDQGVLYDELRMRKAGDYTPDDQLKKQWLDEIGAENVILCIDDRQKVVDMWRAQGLTVFQVAAGDF